MISFYLTLALTTPAWFVLLPWALVALLICFQRPQWFGRFFGTSAVVCIVGAVLLAHYAADPAVDGDGTTFFGAAILIGTFFVFGFVIFLIGACVALLRQRYLDARTSEVESL